MVIERAPGGTHLGDVLDRVLDKGIVIDAYIRVSVAGIDLVSVDAMVLVASVERYLNSAGEVWSAGRFFSTRSGDESLLERLRQENEELRRRLRAAGESEDGG